MEYYVGGYYLVEGNATEDGILVSAQSRTVWSPCDDVCSLHPPASALSWVKGETEQNEYRKKLRLSQAEFELLQAEVDSLFNQDKLGWISTFIERDAAIHFAKKYLQHIPNIKLMMVATEGKYRDLFLEEEAPKGNNGAGGVYLSLKKKVLVENQTNFTGFDVLGYSCGDFQSFVWNCLDKHTNETLNIKLNESGLVESHEDTSKIEDYVSNLYDLMEGPSLPWAIYDIPLK